VKVSRRQRSFFPAVAEIRQYSRQNLPDDLVAGLMTAVLLIPQALAYAALAGLPVEVGLYASILPPVVYALMGTSRTLSIGPVALSALLVANALSGTAELPGSPAYVADALLLAALSGLIFLAMALLRLDVLVNFIGHPVLSGFTTAAAILIIIGQIPSLVGVDVAAAGSGLDKVAATAEHLFELHLKTTLVGLASLALLLLLRTPLVTALERLGLSNKLAGLASRTGPLVVIVVLTVLVANFNLDREGVAIVGAVPAGLPIPSLDFLRLERISALLPSAFIISLIGYVGSISVAKSLAHRRRERVDNNQELVALGFSNIAASLSGSMPVAGGFSRSSVNFAAGAQTQLSAVIGSILVAAAALYFTPLFYYLPKAALAATIVVSVLSLLDWKAARDAWHYDRADGTAWVMTFLGVLAVNIEVGLLAGVLVGLGSFIWRSSRPHMAIVGRVPGTEHFRNVQRHGVQTWPNLMLLRVDRSLFFANINYVGDEVARVASEQSELEHLVIICSAVNTIDHSALEALELMALNLREAGITLHLAEVKGPVMDRLKHTDFEEQLAPGRIFLSTDGAVHALTSFVASNTLEDETEQSG
tara:strand:- start:4672 stop:6444 length:1773 start_codon:yes stop_codon:yes gene_type:complete